MRRLILITIVWLTSGCSLEASIMSLDSVSEVIEDLSNSMGLVSGSSQTATASGGGGSDYLVQSTVGNYSSGVEQATTDDTYKVYSSVQGAIISN